ncbi:MAG: hypothetical protein JSW50_08795 [Candidatus Latescibacterota bacterium]|nr:MAG: hypothetical protein JSW50_08795 [Candidatus Latescibacterota bacterium]
MRNLLISIVLLTVAAVPALGQSSWISMFSDIGGTDCNLPDVTPQLTPYYVVHYMYTPEGSTASQFWAPQPWCLGAIYLSDTAVFPVTIGNSQEGVSIGYGSCHTNRVHVLTLNFFTQGTSPSCCCYFVYPHPASTTGEVEVVDCNNNLVTATGGWGYVNADWVNCGCWVGNQSGGSGPAGPYGCINDPIAVEQATWGKVKSLYSD